MKQKNNNLILKLVAGALFAALFTINATALVPTSGNAGHNVSLQSLMANASAEAETGGGSNYGSQCGQDDCDVVGTPWGVGVIAHGHYFHCKTVTDTKQTCNSSSCTTACDAVIHI